MENPIKMDDLGVPPILGNTHVLKDFLLRLPWPSQVDFDAHFDEEWSQYQLPGYPQEDTNLFNDCGLKSIGFLRVSAKINDSTTRISGFLFLAHLHRCLVIEFPRGRGFSWTHVDTYKLAELICRQVL